MVRCSYPKSSIIELFYFVLMFLVIFITRIYGIIDIPLIVGFLFFLLAFSAKNCSYPKIIWPYIVFLFFISGYSILISIINGGAEMIFALKFIHSLLLLFLLYYVWLKINNRVSYDTFTRYFVLMVAIHSIIIIGAIIFSDFRHFLYGLTGYLPKGPEWSRSPGLTISYNSTAIVHIAGLWFLLSRKDWVGWRRWLISLLILSSFIFLGRFISFIGLFLILFLLLLGMSWSNRFITGVVIVVCARLLIWLSNIEYDVTTVEGQILSNYHHFIDPLILWGKGGGADNFIFNILSDHIYFSNQWHVVLFGDSHAGHIGIMKGDSGIGETDSDIGIINSINANGIIVTVLIYISYLFIMWTARHYDWKPIVLVAILSLALSFKETGLFTSHATPLLFFLYFYQLLGKRSIVLYQYRRNVI